MTCGLRPSDERLHMPWLQDQPTEFVLDESVFRGNTAQQNGGAVGAASFEDANFTALAFSSNVVSGGQELPFASCSAKCRLAFHLLRAYNDADPLRRGFHAHHVKKHPRQQLCPDLLVTLLAAGSGGAIYASSFTSVLLGGCNFTSNQVCFPAHLTELHYQGKAL